MIVDRIQQGSTANISIALSVGGVAEDPTPDSADVTITRADGSVLVPPDAANDSGTGVFSYPLDPTMTAQLDTLTAVWEFVADAHPQTRTTVHEIVGGFLFTTGELRAMSTGTGGLANVTNYPVDKLTAMRTRVEQALEDACGVAFVPRYTLETVSGWGGTQVQLSWPKVRSIRVATVDGLAATGMVGMEAGLAYLSSSWTVGYGNVTIGYEHGYSYPPERIRQAALLLAKQWLTPTAVDDRAINMTNDSGTYALFQAGVRGHSFSIPEVQAAVDQYDLHAGVA